MIQGRGGKHSMEYTHGTKWVLIKLVDACFTGEF